MTFKKIVVGLDQSFKDSLVFSRALEQARPHVSSMIIVHTLKLDREAPSMATGIHTSDAQDMYSMLQRRQQSRVQEATTKAHEWMEMYFQQSIAKGIPTQIDCRVSDPGLWLCEVAQRWGADLIVIGHREHQGFMAMGANSVSQYVLQHASCSVLVVNGIEQLQELNQIAHHEQRPKEDLLKPVRTPAEARLESQMFRI
jgi:nucleotide-binding universal stress UspA family protein